MKVKFGAIVVDGRNKIGGHVLSKNRAGSYMRTKVTPVNPQSADQTEVRNRLTGFSQDWRGLTDSQRLAWSTAVENFKKTDIFGDLKAPSGINLYNRLNLNLAAAGQAAISTPPSPSDTPQLTSLTLTSDVSSTTVEIAFGPSPVPAGTTMVVSATPNYSPGVSFVKNKFRQIATVAAAQTTPQNLWSSYIAKFGTPVAGQKISVLVHLVDNATGLTSLPLRADCTVTA